MSEERGFLFIRPNGESGFVRVSGRGLALGLLQGLVGGHIETVPSCLGKRWMDEDNVKAVLVVHEEGKLIGLSENLTETLLLDDLIHDVLVGTVLLVGEGRNEDGEWDLICLSRDVCARIHAAFTESEEPMPEEKGNSTDA